MRFPTCAAATPNAKDHNMGLVRIIHRYLHIFFVEFVIWRVNWWRPVVYSCLDHDQFAHVDDELMIYTNILADREMALCSTDGKR